MTETVSSTWTTDVLKQLLDATLAQRALYFDELVNGLRSIIDERDRRYEQRFIAQEHAVALGLEGADKAITARLAASDTAIAKAEAASSARFASVNEFRATLSDQATTFVPRAEHDQRITTVLDKVEGLRRAIEEQNIAANRFMPRSEAEATIAQNGERIQTIRSELSGFMPRGEGEARSAAAGEKIDALRADLNAMGLVQMNRAEITSLNNVTADRVDALSRALAAAQLSFSPKTEIDALRATMSDKQDSLRADIVTLTARLDLQAGRNAGLDAGWKILIGLVGLLAAVAGIAIAVYGATH